MIFTSWKHAKSPFSIYGIWFVPTRSICIFSLRKSNHWPPKSRWKIGHVVSCGGSCIIGRSLQTMGRYNSSTGSLFVYMIFVAPVLLNLEGYEYHFIWYIYIYTHIITNKWMNTSVSSLCYFVLAIKNTPQWITKSHESRGSSSQRGSPRAK